MPQKRAEAIEKVDAGEMMPDIYEKWLNKQKATDTRAKPGFVGGQAAKLDEDEEEDREEDHIEKAEDAHEQAKHRKRSKTSR